MKKRFNLLILYDIIAGTTLIFTLIYMVATHTSIIEFLDTDTVSIFGDFTLHINFSKDLANTYNESMHACFPPFIYLFYHFVGLLLDDFDNQNAIFFLNAIINTVLFCVFTFVCTKTIKYKDNLIVLSMIALLCLSTGFTFGVIERANIVFLVLILLLVASNWRESDDKIKRELAMICIAVAAAIKIYPAVFGLIYIAEKRFKEAFRLIIYGILFFFVPFIFTGGIDGIKTFFKNQSSVHTTWGINSKVSIYSLACFYNVNKKLAITLSIVFALIALFVVFFAKQKWQKYFALSFIMVMCPMWSGQYTLCLFVIPFIAFLNEQKNNVYFTNIINTVLFSLFLSASIFNNFYAMIRNFFAIIALFIIIIVQILFDLYYNKSNKTTV